jgi:hypothetical protein
MPLIFVALQHNACAHAEFPYNQLHVALQHKCPTQVFNEQALDLPTNLRNMK